MGKIWTAVLTLCVILCISSVTSQEQPAFFLAVTFSGTTAFFNFTDVMFHKFYHCLGNRNLCEIQRDDYGTVISVRGCLPEGNTGTIDELTCKSLTYRFFCKRGSYSDAEQIESCPEAKYYNYEIRNDADLSSTARTTWLDIENMVMESHISGITVERLSSSGRNYKYAITGTFTTTLLPPTTPTTTTATTATTTTATMTTKRKTTVSAATKTSKSIPSASPITPATTVGSLGTSEHGNDVGDDSKGIIIGAAVGGAVVIVVIVIIVVILWRRKNRTPSSSSANNNKIDDTDIYPYENSNLNNVNSNLNLNNQNTNPNDPTQDTFATVDAREKINSINTSPYYNTVNIDNENKLEQTKTQFNPSLDYIEIDETTEAGHYQRVSDVNNHEISTSGIMPPPHPSDSSAQPKNTYYNVSF